MNIWGLIIIIEMIRDDSEKQIHGKQNRLMDIRTILGTIENSY